MPVSDSAIRLERIPIEDYLPAFDVPDSQGRLEVTPPAIPLPQCAIALSLAACSSILMVVLIFLSR